MLTHLYISQYALIEQLNLDIASGFVTITGETGSGKSIIMGALGLIFGDRADTKVIRTGATKSVIEATFSFQNDKYRPIFDDADIDYQSECIVRREIGANGKSRAFINDTPVTQQTLRNISSHLIDIHSQYENLLLKDSGFQLSVLDTAAHTEGELLQYQKVYDNFNRLTADLKILTAEAERMSAEKEYMQYQYDRLYEANLVDGEQEELEQEAERMSHTEEIKSDLGAASDAMENDEYGIVQQLKDATTRVENATRYYPSVGELGERMKSLLIELKDVDNELSGYFDSLDFDPQRKEFVESRLDTIYTLQQKHRLSSCEELIALRDELSQKLEKIDNYDSDIADLKKQLTQCEEQLKATAAVLTEKRKGVAPEIAQYLMESLHALGMPNANVVVDIKPFTEYGEMGGDDVQFLFTANKNMPLQPIVSVASGGEVSRVMLALKSLIVRKSEISTIIFDEVDTGVSGDIAGRMAEMMNDMAHYVQVLSITHLPQIAARGGSQYRVYKTDDETTTTTHIDRLTNDQRITEIAEMLSGKHPSEAALRAAAELLNN